MKHVHFRLALLGCLACAASALPGCGAQPVEIPPTYPVHGRVAFADGQPLTCGMVHFQSLDDRQVSMTGEVDANGRFTIETFVVGDRVPGAVEGRHRVTILPAISDQLSQPTVIPEPIIVAPGENELSFTIERTKI